MSAERIKLYCIQPHLLFTSIRLEIAQTILVVLEALVELLAKMVVAFLEVLVADFQVQVDDFLSHYLSLVNFREVAGVMRVAAFRVGDFLAVTLELDGLEVVFLVVVFLVVVFLADMLVVVTQVLVTQVEILTGSDK